ncbi:hypothetical protein CDAR_384281 [Caerostris darwini]|uniref:Uncharacterized protein n=1 Tax=Caerostris darwini TaxID=1538125 RepID=A0AAV4QUE2_9ARAC|nr:hypothetical protein CDAR_384281 [Caerostris darwini]
MRLHYPYATTNYAQFIAGGIVSGNRMTVPRQLQNVSKLVKTLRPTKPTIPLHQRYSGDMLFKISPLLPYPGHPNRRAFLLISTAL